MARLVADAWSAAAPAYAATWAPRFSPWVNDALAALAAAARAHPPPPPGPVLALGCGPTGDELVALADAFPARAVAARDISPGMVDRARAALNGDARISVSVGDARTAASTDMDGPPSIIFSAFTLQALPSRPAVVRGWVRGLPAGGLAALLWWPPPDAQPDRAWAAVTAGPPEAEADAGEHASILAAATDAGGAVVLDTAPVHDMAFGSRGALADALVGGGPLTVAAVVEGGGAARRRAEEAAGLASEAEGGGVVVRPAARLVVVRKGRAAARL